MKNGDEGESKREIESMHEMKSSWDCDHFTVESVSEEFYLDNSRKTKRTIQIVSFSLGKNKTCRKKTMKEVHFEP